MPSVTVLGTLEEFAKRAEKHVQESIQPVLEEHAEKVLATAKSLVPVETGLLRDTLNTKQSKGKNFVTVRTDGKRAPHGHLVHFGTAKMEGRPFLYQAADIHRAELKEALQAALDKKD